MAKMGTFKKYRCWDSENERWIYQDDENEFSFTNGKWKVQYMKEINRVRDEMDVPVWKEVEDPIVMEY